MPAGVQKEYDHVPGNSSRTGGVGSVGSLDS